MTQKMTRRTLLQALGIAAAGAPLTALAQGRCRDGYGTQGCPLPADVATKPIPPLFTATG